jgi:hypothetical protein
MPANKKELLKIPKNDILKNSFCFVSQFFVISPNRAPTQGRSAFRHLSVRVQTHLQIMALLSLAFLRHNVGVDRRTITIFTHYLPMTGK